MLTAQQNELLTRVGPGTPMGETLRRYWLPALLDWELPEPDCAPVRLRLLSEDLVAFRDTSGRVGVLDEYCPHRLTSLWLGRNEENGLRCVYHGWKFDVTGQCVDQMNEPNQFASKIRTVSYPVAEAGGVLWVYMGPEEKQPPPPNFAWTGVPAEHRVVTKVVEECNWLQALEGGIDTSHAPIMHRALRANPAQPGIPVNDAFVQGAAPSLEVDVTDYGYRYFGIRPLGAEQQYVRGYHFVMPWTQLRPAGRGIESQTHGHHWVPIDDYRCLVWNWYYNEVRPLDKGKAGPEETGNIFGVDVDAENGFPLDPQPVQRLADRPRGPEDGHVHGHRGHQHAGPRRAGADGPDRGPLPRAPGPGGQGDHRGAEAAGGGGADRAGRGRPAGRRAQLLRAARCGEHPPGGRRLARGPHPAHGPLARAGIASVDARHMRC